MILMMLHLIRYYIMLTIILLVVLLKIMITMTMMLVIFWVWWWSSTVFLWPELPRNCVSCRQFTWGSWRTPRMSLSSSCRCPKTESIWKISRRPFSRKSRRHLNLMSKIDHNGVISRQLSCSCVSYHIAYTCIWPHIRSDLILHIKENPKQQAPNRNYHHHHHHHHHHLNQLPRYLISWWWIDWRLRLKNLNISRSQGVLSAYHPERRWRDSMVFCRPTDTKDLKKSG